MIATGIGLRKLTSELRLDEFDTPIVGGKKEVGWKSIPLLTHAYAHSFICLNEKKRTFKIDTHTKLRSYITRTHKCLRVAHVVEMLKNVQRSMVVLVQSYDS